MENYLKGKQRIESSCNHLESVQSSLEVNTGLPSKENNRIQITGKEGEPSVECVTKDGRISKILITCKCGEQIELNCQYS